METTAVIPSEALSAKQRLLLFRLKRGERYNIKRRRFFDNLHNLTTAISLLLGSGTMVRLVMAQTAEDKNTFDGIMLTFAAATTVLGTFSLVAKYTEKARQYHDLAKRIYALEQRVIKEPLTEENLVAWNVEYLMIEADELPSKRVLNMICHNEVMKAMGYDDDDGDMVVIAWYQRLFSQFVDIAPHWIKKRSQKTRWYFFYRVHP